MLTAGTPAGGVRRTPAGSGRAGTPAGGGQMDAPALQGAVHACDMGEGGYGGSPIGEAGKIYQQQCQDFLSIDFEGPPPPNLVFIFHHHPYITGRIRVLRWPGVRHWGPGLSFCFWSFFNPRAHLASTWLSGPIKPHIQNSPNHQGFIFRPTNESSRISGDDFSRFPSRTWALLSISEPHFQTKGSGDVMHGASQRAE